LLHDITHVPFGHTIEDELNIFTPHDNNPIRINRFLGPESKIATLIQKDRGKDFYKQFLSIFLWTENDKTIEAREKGDTDTQKKEKKAWDKLNDYLGPDQEIKAENKFIHDLVSNTVCADMLDYIKRDSYFCNLSISLEYRFLKFLYLEPLKGHENEESLKGHENKNKGPRLLVRLWKRREGIPRRDTLTDLARLLEARYMIAERAYFHHAKIISGAMLGRALYELTSRNLLKESDLYEHSDDTLLQLLCTSKDIPVAHNLGKRLRERGLYKVIHKFTKLNFQEAQERNHVEELEEKALKRLRDPEIRRQMEDSLAEKIERRKPGAKGKDEAAQIDPGSILIYAPSRSMAMKAAAMNVLWAGGHKKLDEIEDSIIKNRLEGICSAHKNLWGIWIIGIEELTEEEKKIIRDQFRIEFLLPDGEEKNQLDLALNKKIIERRLEINNPKFNVSSARQIYNNLTEAAESLRAIASDNRPYKTKLKEACDIALGKPIGKPSEK